MPKRCQNATKTPPKRHQNATKTPPPSHVRCFLWGKHTIRARGESNRLPPGSDPPTSRGPDHYANPAPEPPPSQRLPMHSKYRPWASSARQLFSVQKNTTLKNIDAQYPKTSLFRRFSRKNTLRARGESNRVPPGSDPPASRGPNHYANPAPEPPPSQRLPMHRKYRPWASSARQLSSVQKNTTF